MWYFSRMESVRQFNISQDKKKTAVSVSGELALVLQHHGVTEFARNYGSRIIKTSGAGYIEIVPPIPKSELQKLGDMLVELTYSLELKSGIDTPVRATHDIQFFET
jgi:hypothetical protein